MDSATRRLLNSILAYLDNAPPNVSNDLLKDLQGFSERVTESYVASEKPTPGQLAVAQSIGKDEPDPYEFASETVEKSPGQREAQGIAPSEV